MAKYFVAMLVLAAVYAAEGKAKPLQITIHEHNVSIRVGER